jgi:hypothetical protein
MRNLVIPEGESVKDAVAVMGSVRVDGEVRGDVTAVMGSVEVYGLVEGTVVAVGGSVIVGPDGEISRDATSIGGTVERRSGGTVRGSTAEVPMLGSGWNRSGIDLDRQLRHRQDSWWSAAWALFWWAIWLILLSLLVSVIVLVAPRFVEQTGWRIGNEWWKAGLVGLLMLIIFLPVWAILIVMLTISIIGIPLMILLVLVTPFLLLGTWLLGLVAAARCAGQWVLGKLDRSPSGEYAPVIVGVAVLSSFDLIGHLFDLLAVGLGVFHIPASFFHGLGNLAWLVATVIGIGAVVLVVLERRRSRLATPPSTPPVPPPGPDVGGFDPTADAAYAGDAEPTWDEEPSDPDSSGHDHHQSDSHVPDAETDADSTEPSKDGESHDDEGKSRQQ